MGPLGTQEMIVIFILALLLFGPKKLPELGRTVAKALAEFRRASNDLKQQFEREMNSIEQETQPLKEIAQSYQNELTGYNYDHSYYDSDSHGYGSSDSTSASQPSVGASESQGAESPAAVEASSSGTPDGSVAHSASTESASPAEFVAAHSEAHHQTDGQQAPDQTPSKS